MLAPYANVLDRVESPEAKDLTAFVPRPPELPAEEYDPERVASILPRLRNAAVSRLVSLDPLSHPDLRLLAAVPRDRRGWPCASTRSTDRGRGRTWAAAS